MAIYSISAANRLRLIDQTGSALTASNLPKNNVYNTTIIPQYATGALYLKLTNWTGNNNDELRIYDDLPSKYTASFVYTGSVTGSGPGALIAYIAGNQTLPLTYTASTGKAYIAFNTNNNGVDWTLEWTGSGFQTPDLNSSVYNRYSVTFPKTSTPNGSYLTFDKGRFTGSALTTNADIIFGTWLKPMAFPGGNNTEVYGIYSLGVTPDATHTPGIAFYKPASSNDLRIIAIDSANTTTTALIMSGAMEGGGGSGATQYIPQWHHYGFVIKRIGTNMSIRGYKDGQIFASGGFSGLTAGGNFATTYDHVLGNIRGGTGNIVQSQNFSGSIDDAFLITIATGSTDAQFNSFFSDIYNSGSWKDPTLATGSLSASLNPKVQFAWRFEETGSILNTRDYGTYGNIHSASSQVTGAGAITLTPTASGYSYTPYTSLSYNIISQSNATVSFTTGAASVYENTASYVFGVQALTAAIGLNAVANVVLTSSSETTASIGTNYNLIYNGTTYSSSAQMPIYVTFSAGDTTTKYITASIFDNTTYTNTSASVPLKIEQGTSTNITVTSPFTFTLKILDYEEGNPSFTTSSYSVGETTSSVNFYVSRLSGSNGPLSVYCTTVDGTALSGTNYVGISGSFTWNDGDSSTKTGSVTILNDNVYSSPDKYFSLLLYNLSTGSFLPYAITSSTITINDQTAGTFNWSSPTLTAYETGTLATISVTRTSGTYGAVTVNVTGSSSLGQTIRTTMSGTLLFNDGDTSGQFTINIQDDLLDESNDIIYYKLYPTASYGTAFTGSSGILSFTLIDNETGSISFTTGSASVYENTSSYYVGVQRLYGGDQAATASITYLTSLIEGSEYNIIYNGITQSSPVTINWSDQDKATKYITASIVDNHIVDVTRNINFSVNTATSASIGPTSSFNLSILDYEEGYITFTSSSYYTGESSGSVLLYLNRISGSNGPLSIDFATQNGSALSGTNYDEQHATLTWADGETTGKAVVIDILYDGVQTSTLDFKVNLSNLSTGSWSYYPSAITSSTVYITDQEPGTFKFTSSSYSVIEGQSVTVGVQRYSGSFDTVTVNITSSNATAVSGTDYSLVNQNLVFNNGETSKTFTVTTLENSTNVSGSLYFNLGINSLTPNYGTSFAGSPYTSTINIIDNETGSVKFVSASYTGSQNSTIKISVERYIASGVPDFAATASVVVLTSSTAVAGSQYTNIFPYSTNLKWADQESGSKDFTITTLGGWNADTILNLALTDLTNLGTGSIMTASILIKSNVLTQSANPCLDHSLDFTINKYCNLSNQYTRRTEQVPFSFGNNPFVRLQQAYSSSKSR